MLSPRNNYILHYRLTHDLRPPSPSSSLYWSSYCSYYDSRLCESKWICPIHTQL